MFLSIRHGSAGWIYLLRKRLKMGVLVFRLLWLLIFYLTFVFTKVPPMNTKGALKMKVSLYHFCALYVSYRKTNSHPSYLNTWFLFFLFYIAITNEFIKHLAVNGSWQQLCFFFLFFIFNFCESVWYFRAMMVSVTNWFLLFLQSLLALNVHPPEHARKVFWTVGRAAVHSIHVTHIFINNLNLYRSAY